jgi:hypothetical protein
MDGMLPIKGEVLPEVEDIGNLETEPNTVPTLTDAWTGELPRIG